MFLISNGLYLTTVYDEVNDLKTLCISVCVSLRYMDEGVLTDSILNTC